MIKSLISKYWREFSILFLICAVGFLATRKDKVKIETVVEVKEKVVVKVEERIIYKDRDVVKTRVVTVNKEGERREEERVESKERVESTRIHREETKTVDNRRTESVEQVRAPERFVLGLSYNFRDESYGGRFLVRVLPNIPISVGPEVNLRQGKLGLGIGVQIAL